MSATVRPSAETVVTTPRKPPGSTGEIGRTTPAPTTGGGTCAWRTTSTPVPVVRVEATSAAFAISVDGEAM